MPVYQEVKKWSQIHPQKRAFTLASASMDYRSVIARCDELLLAIKGLNVKPCLTFSRGLLIAFIARNDHNFATKFLASTFGKNTSMVLSPSLPASQIYHCLTELAPDLVLHDSKITPIAHQLGIPILDISSFAGNRGSSYGFDNFENNDCAPFLIGFTSGTTSYAKAFIRNRKSWQISIERSRKIFAVDETLTTLAPGPLAHGLSLYAMAETLSAGAHFVTMDMFDVGKIIKLIKAHEVKRLVVVPTMLYALCQEFKNSARQLTSITSIITAGARLEKALLSQINQMMPNAIVSQYYGASELGFVSYIHHQDDKSASVGRAFSGVEIKILDDKGQRLPFGKPGIIFVKSDLICDGYVSGNDGKGFYLKDGWASVGDIGYLDDENRLYLLGRSGGMVVSGGNNIYPQSVEGIIGQVPGVRQVVAFGVENNYSGSKLIAVITADPKHISEKAIQTICKAQLPVYALPKEIYLTKVFPLTESGKISIQLLKDWIDKNDQRLQLISHG